MIKIFEKSNSKKVFEKNTSKKHSRKTFSDLNFQEILETEKVDIEKNEIQELISDLDVAGKDLGNAPSIMHYRKYKDIVKKILKKTVLNTYGLKKNYSLIKGKGDLEFDKKEHKIVTIIDEELDSLLKLIHNNEKQNILYTSKVIKIKGLMVDVIIK